MQKFINKSLAIGAVSGLMIVGGASMASADTVTSSDSQMTETQVSDNQVRDAGNLELGDIANDVLDLDGVASNNNLLSGNGTVLSELLNGNASGNDTDVSANPDVDNSTDADTSADTGVDATSDNDGLLGGLMN